MTSESEPTPEPEQTTPKPEPNELGIAPFVDESKDPQSYVNRYNNEVSYKKWFDDNYKEYSSIYAAVGLKKPAPKTILGKQFMLWTTIVAALTAGANLFIIFWMSGSNPFVEMIINFVLKPTELDSKLTLTALDPGLGLAAIGIMTFFGVSLSSSIFEEHRHKHENKHENEQKDNPILNIIAGKGIMRKGLASSLVMTYIVLIGLSFSAGTLDNPFSDGDDTNNVNETSLNNSTVQSSSKDVITNIVIKDIVKFDSMKVTTTNQTSNSIEEVILEKEPSTLVQHFTIVISVVIGFYFSSNIITAYLKTRKEN